MTNSLFDRIHFVMVAPSHPGNVGAAARALKTMGFGRLHLVGTNGSEIIHDASAQALASGASDVLEAAKVHSTLSDALAHTTLAFALTARGRDMGPPACDVRQAAGLAREHLTAAQSGLDLPQKGLGQAFEGLSTRAGAGPVAERHVAVVLGTERSGLTNDHISRCQWICHIPANPDYSSLNVAQALQLMAWELRYALSADTWQSPAPGGYRPPPQPLAPGGAVEAFLEHWQQALTAVGFLDPLHPKKLMLRMRHLFTRSSLTQDEVDMLRGVCTAMLKSATGHQAANKPSRLESGQTGHAVASAPVKRSDSNEAR